MKNIHSTLALFRRINSLVAQDSAVKKLILPYFIACILVALLPIGSNVVTAVITNKLQDAHKLSLHSSGIVTGLAGLYVGIALLPLALREISNRISSRINSYLTRHFDMLLKRKLATLEYSYLDDSEFHDTLKNVREKGVTMVWGIFTSQILFSESFITMTVSLAAVSILKLEYLAILVVSVIPLMYIQIINKKNRKELTDLTRSEQRYANVYADEAGTRESRVFNLGQQYLTTFDIASTKILDRILSFEDRRVIKSQLCWVFHGIGVFFIVNQIYAMIISGEFKLGTGLFMISSMWFFSTSLRVMTGLVSNFYENVIYAREYIQVLELPRIIKQAPSAKAVHFTKGPFIVFDNVSFFYPGKSKPALEQVSFEIDANSKIAFIGDNGGGKSTAVKLLLRFYNPSSGNIIIDGQNIVDITIESWLNIIGYVAQDPSVPNLTIREILTNTNNPTEEFLWDAIRRSSSDEFIKGYEHGIDQRLGKMFKGGVNPSHGQRQRLAISRAYSRNPKLLIFDEPTADLDPETQHRVFDDFYTNNPNVTGIIIAHALQGVIAADKLFVFENGKLTQKGSHDTLIRENGWYRNSFKKQSKPFQSFVH